MPLPKIISKALRTGVLVLGPIFLVWGLAWAYGATALWDATFETTPPNNESVSLGDDAIREFKGTVRDYAEAEMNWGTAGNQTGRMLEGSARAFWEAADPAIIKGTDRTGSNAITSADEGRLLRRSDTGELKILNNAGAWIQAVGALSGTINLINTPLFAGTAGGADTFDPREFTIRNIVIDDTTDAVDCPNGGNISPTALASQAFGAAGIACYSVSLNLTGRSTANSRALVIAQLTGKGAGGGCGNGNSAYTIFLDSTATQIGDQLTNTVSLSTGSMEYPMSVNYITNLTSASHEFALHVSTTDANCDFHTNMDGASGNFLMVIDLGPDYP